MDGEMGVVHSQYMPPVTLSNVQSNDDMLRYIVRVSLRRMVTRQKKRRSYSLS